jgi:hypothetical protein
MRPTGSAAQLEYRRQLGGNLLAQGKGVHEVACLLAVAPSSVTRWKQALVPWYSWHATRAQTVIVNQVSFGALRRAAHLIAISKNTRRDLIYLCRCDSEKITVIFYGVDAAFRPYRPEEKS